MIDKNFPIVITTYKRETKEEQVLFFQIPEEYRDIIYVFCRESRVELLKKNVPEIKNIVTIPDDTDIGIARTRQVVLDKMRSMGFNRVWMADDRIKLMIRHEDERIRMMRTKEEFEFIYDGLNELSKQHVMVSLAHRKVGSLAIDGVRKKGVLVGGRAYANYALQLDKLADLGIRFDDMWQKDNEIRLFEDFYVVLSLLTRGIPNALWTDGAMEHYPGGGKNPTSGNGSYRTQELQDKCARALANEFPDFVKVVQKDASWGENLVGGRTDVTCYWQKALEYGQKKLSGELDEPESVGLDEFF